MAWTFIAGFASYFKFFKLQPQKRRNLGAGHSARLQCNQYYPLWWIFHVPMRRYAARMGSMPRREQRERTAREQAEMQPGLDCEACGAITPASCFRYFADRIICAACESQNPQNRVRNVPRETFVACDILINFVQCHELRVQAMAADARTSLSPFVPIASGPTLRRLLAYLGATPEQLQAFDTALLAWGQGSVPITLQPGAKICCDWSASNRSCRMEIGDGSNTCHAS